MAESNSQKQIYIVVTQTGTILSRILKRITGKEYNHASLSLNPDLHIMYSFGRRHPYNPFWGGFVLESPLWGTFKRFSETKAVVLAVDINRDTHKEICNIIHSMLKERKKYRYNYLGLWLAAFHIHYSKKNRYYCSEFVGDILKKFSIEGG